MTTTGQTRPADSAPENAPTTPDFTAWDMLDSFTIAEAALLWLNMEPLNNDVSTGPYKRQALARALADKLGLAEGHLDSDKMIARESLRSLATNSNKRPPFLFDEDRQEDSEESPEGKSLGKRERTTLLVIIAALCKIADLDLAQPNKAAGSIAAMSDQLGASVDAGGIAEKLKEIIAAVDAQRKQNEGRSKLTRAAKHPNPN